MRDLSRRSFLSLAAAAAGTALARRALGGDDAIDGCRLTPPPATGVNDFGYDLFGRLRAKPGNAFASPFSISVALAMTAAGARGKTLDEMRKVLHLPADDAATDDAFRSLLAKVNAPGDRGYQLSTANAVWAQTGYPWRKAYLDRVSGTYGAGVIDTDFKADPEAARVRINTWVEKETRDKIKDLVARGLITKGTAMVLTNAVYFKGDWAAKFDQKLTHLAPFTVGDWVKKSTPMMHRTGDYKLHEDDAVRVLELPYKGDELSMAVLLPRKADGLAGLEKSLSAKAVAGWLDKARRPQPVEVYLPKFKVEADYRLAAPLQDLGMKAAFGGSADFTGMYTGGAGLNISEVVHKAFVDVNEEGTEAAAATAVIVREASMPRPTPVFRADRPFLFLIRHAPTDTVLFLGRVTNPTA